MNKQFSAEDGRIERVQIDRDSVMIYFQIWNARKLVLIYGDVDEMFFQNPVGVDVGEYRVTELPDGKMNYSFYDAWNSERIVSITSGGYHIQEQ